MNVIMRSEKNQKEELRVGVHPTSFLTGLNMVDRLGRKEIHK